jgi:hypothetical protein
MSDDDSNQRYGMRPSAVTGYWAVYNVETGEIAVINGTRIDMLTIEEADDAVDLLNHLDLEQRWSTKQ